MCCAQGNFPSFLVQTDFSVKLSLSLCLLATLTAIEYLAIVDFYFLRSFDHTHESSQKLAFAIEFGKMLCVSLFFALGERVAELHLESEVIESTLK
jgi:hypothetical protein